MQCARRAGGQALLLPACLLYHAPPPLPEAALMTWDGREGVVVFHISRGPIWSPYLRNS